MSKFYFTFGTAHTRTVRGMLFDYNTVCEIEAETYAEARDKMFESFGQAWAFQYEEGELDLSFFPKGIVKLPEAEVTRVGLACCQVCVPKTWTDEQALAFAEREFPCVLSGGWQMRKEGSDYLAGDPERNQCTEYKNHVHISFDA